MDLNMPGPGRIAEIKQRFGPDPGVFFPYPFMWITANGNRKENYSYCMHHDCMFSG